MNQAQSLEKTQIDRKIIFKSIKKQSCHIDYDLLMKKLC